MKFKFANGHSVNIWDSEYERIVISEGRITCTRPGGKIAVIEIPRQWMQGTGPKPEIRREVKGSNGATPEKIHFQEEHLSRISSSSDPTSPYARTGTEKEGTSAKSEAQREGTDFNGSTRGGMHSLEGGLHKANLGSTSTGTHDRPGAKFEKFENMKKYDVNFSKLANQIEALKSDLIRFKTETDEQMKPLLAPPIALKELLNETIPELKRSVGYIDKNALLFETRCDKICSELNDLYDDVERIKRVCHPSGIAKQGSSVISQTGAFEQGRRAGTRKKNKLCESLCY